MTRKVPGTEDDPPAGMMTCAFISMVQFAAAFSVPVQSSVNILYPSTLPVQLVKGLAAQSFSGKTATDVIVWSHAPLFVTVIVCVSV